MVLLSLTVWVLAPDEPSPCTVTELRHSCRERKLPGRYKDFLMK